ncbi:MAG TPA: hypothetical protein IAB06_03020 [Candidatus Avacidaminococcus intestinavium]|uniref:DUF3887 domain-containing protein n=1 Tax=Candidatus Avacidaminococcus intestinavium TaxID=2840684 RepID=A0A9D1MP14_9FIRM|nr:hypothetical protein [Candidatus Avacidaminococcus intestinavium]
MKKLFLMLALVMMVSTTNICLAGVNGNVLNREEKTIDLLINSLDKKQSTVSYSEIAKGFSPQLKESVTADGLALLQDQVRERFGRADEIKLIHFERFDQGDRATYLGSFSKENVVRLVFIFDKDAKMTDFALSPVTIEENK